MLKVDLVREIATRENEIAKLTAEVEQLKSAHMVLSTGIVGETSKISPVNNGSIPNNGIKRRQNATQKVREYFEANGNQWAVKSQIAKETGISDGSVQNVLRPVRGKSDFESRPIRRGGRNLKWRLKPTDKDSNS